VSPLPADRPRPAPAWLPALLIAPLLTLQLYAFHWGVVSTDTLFQWDQALTGRYDDWHPPATTWLWRQLMHLVPGAAPILIFDCLLYWAGVWLIADALRRRGRNRAMAAMLAVAALPIPFGQMGAILKDPLLAACCLAALGLAVAAEGVALTRRRAACAIACLLLAFASATRFNAVFATAPLLILWMPPRWLAGPARTLPALAAAAAILAGANLLIDGVLLRPHRSQPIFSLVNFDLAGIAAHGGTGAYPDLAPAEERRWVALCYRPGQFNPNYRPECDTVEEKLAVYSEEEHVGPVTLWLRAIARSPLAYARHRLDHLNRNLRFAVGGVPNDAVYLMATAPNPYGLSFHANAATRMVSRAAYWMAVSPLGRPATWLAVALGLLLLAPRLAGGRMVAAAALSALGYGGAYAVVSVAPDLRYNLWTMLAAMVALILAVAGGRRAAIPRAGWLLPLLPALLAVVVELGALAIG